jgi:uncharacterized protein (TIGR01244 family)
LSATQILLARIALLVPTILTLAFAQATFAQNSREQIEGVRNFGRVTDRYFRGGQVTPDGIERLAAMGVRTIVDLRDEESPGEAEVCQQKGIKYFKFPMSGHVTPDDKAISEILSIIERAKEPVYVHCSAGKHRAGTMAALYRIRAQGWSKEQAWAEQKSYGFGPPEGHPVLYAYVYGKQSGSAESADADVAQLTSRSAAVSDEKKSSKKTRKKDDDDDDDSSKAKKKKDDKSLKKDDDDDGDDDKDDGAKGKDRNEQVKREAPSERASAAPAPVLEASSEAKVESANSNRAAAGLSAAASYISVADAIKRARDEGGKGDVLKIDLEWDPARSVVTWDVTFSSGAEYELEATSGKLLGTKSKPSPKLATLSPLALDGSAKRLLTFQEIIRKAEVGHSRTVMEMELKQIKGRSETVYEVVLADGATIFYDAATGNTIAGI